MKSSTKPGSRLIGTSLLGLFLVFFIWACHLNQEGGKENVFSLGTLADSLKKYDSVKVYILAPGGDTLDMIFKGPVTGSSDLVDLPAPNYHGGRAVISIVGYEDDRIVLQVDRIYAGKEGGIESIKNIILPGAEVKIVSPNLEISVGDELPVPSVTVSPDSLADTTIVWSSSNPSVLSIAEGRIKGLADGSVDLKAALKVDPKTSAIIFVRVKAKVAGTAPESLVVTPETLQLTVNGGPRKFTLEIRPAGADREVTWHSRDETKVRISAAGEAEGLKAGLVRIWAASTVDPKVTDSAWVEVTAEVPVTQVEFDRKVMNLFVGGTPDSLVVFVRPDLANPAVDFLSEDTSIVKVKDSKAEGRKVGETRIIASSRQDPTKKDTLKVVVIKPEIVERVDVKPEQDTLYTGGDTTLLKATITPSTSSQRVLWSSSDDGIASVDTNGKVLPVSPGTAYIKAVSRLDITKSAIATLVVKRDPPLFSINNQDTTVAVGTTITWSGSVTQKFGVVTRFEWNLDGDTAWDGSAPDVKPVSHQYREEEIFARFRIRDTEGNVTTVDKKVKSVSGPVILITSPADNSYFNITRIPVSWSVDGKPQTTDTTEVLIKDGANVITRYAKDAANNTYSERITVYLDTVPPGKPLVRAATPVNTQNPRWTWKTGGNGGIGTYRCMLTLADSSNSAEIKDTLFVAPSKLAEGAHTLYVQERDLAGNWSKPGEFKLLVDLTKPAAPKVISAQAVTAELRPAWTWTSAASGGKAFFAFRYRLDVDDMATHTVIKDTTFTPESDLAAGVHTLYVQESDSAGNWSSSGSFSVTIDRTKPAAPVFSTALVSPVNTLRPTWVWTSGGGEGMGTYRARIDNSDLSAATEFKGISHTPPANLTEGSHTLYVEERDLAGNWSPTASKSLVLALRDTVGKRGLSTSGAEVLDFTICPDGTPYLVFSDLAHSSKVTVMQYSNNVWSPLVSPGFADNGVAGPMTITCSKNSKLYIGFTTSEGGEVWTWNPGLSMERLGLNGLAQAVRMTLAISNSGVPYVVHGDSAGALKLDSLSTSGTWVSNGQVVDSASYIAPMTMKFDHFNNLELAYLDRYSKARPQNLTYRGGNWWGTGDGSGFPADSASSISIGFTKTSGSLGNGIRITLAHKGMVTMYNPLPSGWVPQGTTGFASADAASLAIHNGISYVAFADKANSNKAAVRVLEGNTWVNMSGTGMSFSTAENVRIAVHPTSGLPYVAFIEPNNGRKITVMKTAFDQP